MRPGRNADAAAQVASSLGTQSGTPAEAIAFGDVVVLATHNEAVFDAIKLASEADAFSGKVVIDMKNPISMETFCTTWTDGRSLTEAIADALPGARW